VNKEGGEARPTNIYIIYIAAFTLAHPPRAYPLGSQFTAFTSSVWPTNLYTGVVSYSL